MKLDLLSDSLVLVLTELLKNDNLCKLVKYDSQTPLEENGLDHELSDLLFSRIFPFPFNSEIVLEDCSRIHVWFPNGYFDDSGAININDLFFDVVIARSLFLINIDGKPKIRPYEITREIIKTFENKSVGTLGKLHFENFIHLMANDKFDVIRLKTDNMLLS